MKKVLIVILMFVFFCIPVSANSAPKEWKGETQNGVYGMDEDCPILVKKENLTFDVQEFPKDFYTDAEEFNAYKGSVTAEYTFYNPESTPIDARLVFPFRINPSYNVTSLLFPDIEQYPITVNNEKTEAVLRLTYSYGGEFHLDDDIAQLQDTYISDGLYSPTTPVYEYVFNPDTEKAGGGYYICAEWSGTNQNSERLIGMDAQGVMISDEQFTLSVNVENDVPVSVYVIGKPLEELPVWSIHDTSENKNEIKGEMTLKEIKESNLESYCLSFKNDYPVSDVDWFNFMASAMKNEISSEGIFDRYLSTERDALWWFDYSVHFEGEEEVINSVTAPMYPFIHGGYDENIYTYTYLLTPASAWKEFHDLNIQINTQGYLIKDENGFVKNENGYALHLDELPEKDLEFSLCAIEKPARKADSGMIAVLMILGVMLVGVILFVILIIRLLIRLFRKR